MHGLTTLGKHLIVRLTYAILATGFAPINTKSNRNRVYLSCDKIG